MVYHFKDQKPIYEIRSLLLKQVIYSYSNNLFTNPSARHGNGRINENQDYYLVEGKSYNWLKESFQKLCVKPEKDKTVYYSKYSECVRAKAQSLFTTTRNPNMADYVAIGDVDEEIVCNYYTAFELDDAYLLYYNYNDIDIDFETIEKFLTQLDILKNYDIIECKIPFEGRKVLRTFKYDNGTNSIIKKNSTFVDLLNKTLDLSMDYILDSDINYLYNNIKISENMEFLNSEYDLIKEIYQQLNSEDADTRFLGLQSMSLNGITKYPVVCETMLWLTTPKINDELKKFVQRKLGKQLKKDIGYKTVKPFYDSLGYYHSKYDNFIQNDFDETQTLICYKLVKEFCGDTIGINKRYIVKESNIPLKKYLEQKCNSYIGDNKSK